ncbi:uncharacterized protein LOC100369114 [Saccoglossus kowalevskii]|uniref:Uncharacterized protein LOC100369114 n=1 Tax=Saccoglossus kowalevskii TaxID=10224 RepID=A0ABM0GIW7_SACKO|nr:PREDICTED: uncharacterized protein LOC100369114 [Saccoglossus kowalevskii]
MEWHLVSVFFVAACMFHSVILIKDAEIVNSRGVVIQRENDNLDKKEQTSRQESNSTNSATKRHHHLHILKERVETLVKHAEAAPTDGASANMVECLDCSTGCYPLLGSCREGCKETCSALRLEPYCVYRRDHKIYQCQCTTKAQYRPGLIITDDYYGLDCSEGCLDANMYDQQRCHRYCYFQCQGPWSGSRPCYFAYEQSVWQCECWYD